MGIHLAPFNSRSFSIQANSLYNAQSGIHLVPVSFDLDFTPLASVLILDPDPFTFNIYADTHCPTQSKVSTCYLNTR